MIAAPLLPLNTVPRPYATPDILLAVTGAWAARRPDTLPVLVVLGVFLLADFLFQRPPGLYAALVLLMTEGLRRRSLRLRKGSFLGEWLAVGTGIAAVGLANRAVLAVVMTPQPPLGLTLIQVILTVALYPAIAGVAHVALGLRRPAQGEVDALGHRL
nr:rod shape-determining protein MreD [Rubellimicrobium aerolatum]